MSSHPRVVPRQRRRWIAALTIAACAVVAWPTEARRTSILRRVPGGGDWRPATPFFQDPGQPPPILFVAPASGKATLKLAADAAQAAAFGFRLDNVFVLEAEGFAAAAECARDGGGAYLPGQLGCWVRDPFICYAGGEIQALTFDADAPPAGVHLFETFDADAAGWTLDGACWDDGSADPDCGPAGCSAPRTVRSDPGPSGSPDVCGDRFGTGGFIAFADPQVPGCGAAGDEVSASIQLTGLEPGVEYIVQTWWGSKEPMFADATEVLHFGAPPYLLLVDDDDNSPDVRGVYTAALDALDVSYEVWDTANSDDGEPQAADLEDLSHVIWWSGDAFTDPPPGVAGPGAAGEAALGSFLDAGGCLLLSSQDYIFDRELVLTPFMVERLGVVGGTESVGQTAVTGAGPFAGIGPTALAYPFDNFSDRLVPDAVAVPAFAGNQGTAALARDDGTSRATFWAFPFEALPAGDRLEALADFFAWCGVDPTLTVTTAGTGAGTVRSAPPGIDCGGDCVESYPPGTVVDLQATPAPGSTFAGWGGACAGTGGCAVTLESDATVSATFEAEAGGCAGILCLNGDRFEVDVDWRTREGARGQGHAVPFRSDDSGLLWFFTENNWEMLVKVLDGCGINDRFWVFAAATTDVEYTLRVRDSVTGASARYFNPLGRAAASITDTGALDVCDVGAASTASSAPTASSASRPAVVAPAGESAEPAVTKGSCVADSTTLCLGGGRFQVEVEWRTGSNRGPGQVVPFGSDDSGLFWFFTDTNWEMLVKVLDGCGINDHFWVFAAATTDVGYTLRVTDTEHDRVEEFVNPVGRAAPAITDTSAFRTCP